jgi:hypothetical protein
MNIMGTQLKGPLGAFRGKVGSIIGSVVKGRNIITSLHTKSSKPPTKAQLDQRTKFGLVASFLSYFSDLIEIGFSAQTSVGSTMNAAVSYNLKYAITGTSPDFSINYSELSFSRGKLTGPKDSEVEAFPDAKLRFTWTANNAALKLTDPTDQLLILVYNPGRDEVITAIRVATRSALTYTLQLPQEFSGEEVYNYMAFVSTDGRVSNSIYAGAVSVS